MSKSDDGTTVTVTSKGQATIPKAYREKLNIETPGRVRFVESETGEIVIRPVKRPTELRGSLADSDSETAATELLRAEREKDRAALDEKHAADENE